MELNSQEAAERTLHMQSSPGWLPFFVGGQRAEGSMANSGEKDMPKTCSASKKAISVRLLKDLGQQSEEVPIISTALTIITPPHFFPRCISHKMPQKGIPTKFPMKYPITYTPKVWVPQNPTTRNSRWKVSPHLRRHETIICMRARRFCPLLTKDLSRNKPRPEVQKTKLLWQKWSFCKGWCYLV